VKVALGTETDSEHINDHKNSFFFCELAVQNPLMQVCILLKIAFYDISSPAVIGMSIVQVDSVATRQRMI
jgi:hypothetical protein